MKNTRENAEKFIYGFRGEKKVLADEIEGFPDFIDLLTEYGEQISNQHIPNDAHSFEVFSIKECKDSPTGKQAFVGFKLDNNDFHFIGVPYTEPADTKISKINKILDFFNKWEYGTCKNQFARRHKYKKNVQFILWKAGEQGHKNDFWHNFDNSWWTQFIKIK